MISPDLFKIKPSRELVQYSSIGCDDEEIKGLINSHFFNHQVSAVFPDTLRLPADLQDLLTHDTEYYLLEQCPIHLFVEYPFIEAFINKGESTLLSDDTFLDVDFSCGLSPSGCLFFSVPRTGFLELGIEKGPAITVTFFKKYSRYFIVINLKHSSFKPGKSNYERMLKRLHLSQVKMNFILSWEAKDERICPSSIASYFSKKGIKCKECTPRFDKKIFYNEMVPSFQTIADELFDWLGLFLLGATEERGEEEKEYLSSYQAPEDVETVGQVLVIQLSGLLTSHRVLRLWNYIRNYTSLRSNIPWVGLHVHGFEDSPVSWNVQPHSHTVFGNNNYTIISDKGGSVKVCKVFSSFKVRN